MRITIVMPFPSTKPGGGSKIMYEYANRLHEKGHTVSIYHSLKRPYKKMKTPLWLKQLIFRLRGASRPKWFPLHPDITSVIVPEITDRYLPDADIVFSTWWQMTYAISRLSASKGAPFNIIQDYELWAGQQELVHDSYRLPVHHMVIARYLEKIVEEQSGKKPLYLPLAIDLDKFFIRQPIDQRDHQSIMMLYSQEGRKGTTYGLQALTALQQEYPSLRITLFGVYEKPELPAGISYHHKPTNLPELYNQHAIFFTPSLGEGWALPPAEAMASGCAVVCTNIGGHADYAFDEQTALLAEPKNVEQMQAKLRQLLDDTTKRIALAQGGHQYLTKNFNWPHTVQLIEQYFYTALSKGA